ncbi:MAG: transglycosylase SLT domain-containing protein [Rhodosalinus sp.]
MQRAYILRALVGLLLVLAPAQSQAAVPDCEALAAEAGRRAGLPQGLLPAIARMESARSHGGRTQAWPWTLNEGGKGMYFETRQAALTYLRAAVERGVTNIDVGCMQINYSWHASSFSSLENMLDPAINTAYAAAFMLRLRERHGSWRAASSAYHSTTPKYASRYLARLERITGGEIGEMAEQPAPGTPEMVAGRSAGGGAAPVQAPLVRMADTALVPGMSGHAPLFTADLPAGRPPQLPRKIAGGLRERDQVSEHLSRRWGQVLALREGFGAGAARN